MPPSVPPDDSDPQQPMSLKDYASGVANIDRNLQRQTDAYSYFQSALAQINARVSNPNAAEGSGRLPFLAVRFPSTQPDGTHPDEATLDLNTLSVAELEQLLPVFIMFEANAGRELLTAWEQLQSITATTTPVVAAAREQLGAANA